METPAVVAVERWVALVPPDFPVRSQNFQVQRDHSERLAAAVVVEVEAAVEFVGVVVAVAEEVAVVAVEVPVVAEVAVLGSAVEVVSEAQVVAVPV
ncbi:hypothetical protein E2C01_009327 [Portunus trituberculatus]|uniref:Uncharacterized protein n=1 Tax=Portunus trituberculatus TaxID=210409 RepID=A0A5B7D5R7_PORTR|nr:hypothetical protein [Portunus trituberculatus]